MSVLSQKTPSYEKFNHIYIRYSPLASNATRNIGARTKAIFPREHHCFHKQNVSLAYYLDKAKITVEFRGDTLFKIEQKYMNKRNG